MGSADKIAIAILGSGNIGTDLMIKIEARSAILKTAVMVGIEAKSEGLARARAMGVATTDKGIDGLLEMAEFAQVKIVFDATSAAAHRRHHELIARAKKKMIDLTPAALGPYVVPVVNLDDHLEAPDVSLISCGGQATIPIVAAIAQLGALPYAEIVASVASRSAGPGTRANIDEFTQSTARGLEQVGGAKRGKAIIILNPAEPPLLMRNTVFTLSEDVAEEEIAAAVKAMVAEVQTYVPGYRLKQEVQFEHFGGNQPLTIPGYGRFAGVKSSVFLEIEGAADFLPSYAGNLDIMTSAARAVGERLAERELLGGR